MAKTLQSPLKRKERTAKPKTQIQGQVDMPFMLLTVLLVVIGLVMLYGLRLFAASRAVQVMIVLAAVFWSALMRTGFGLCLILLMAVYDLLRKKPKAKLVLSGLISLMYVTGPISNFVLKRYNGQTDSGRSKLLFDCLYPPHLMVLWGITLLI